MSEVYVVLGATGGIGRAVCQELSGGGARIVFGGRDSVKLDELSAQLEGVPCLFEATDVESVDRCLETALTQFDQLDGVVNCVGSLLLKPAHLTSAEEWDHVIATNLRSSFATVRAATQRLRKGGGSIVLVASAAATLGLANHEAIAAAKAGVIGLARSAAATYAHSAIRVNVVSPGLVQTPLTSAIVGNEAVAQASRDLHPMGRLGEPADIGRAIAWFLSPQQSWVTGQVLGVDGGLASLKTRPRSR